MRKITKVDFTKGGYWLKQYSEEQVAYIIEGIQNIKTPTPENIASILDCNIIIPNAQACLRRHLYNQKMRHMVYFTFQFGMRGKVKETWSVIPFYDSKSRTYWRIYRNNILTALTIRRPALYVGHSTFWKDNKTNELSEAINAVLYEIFRQVPELCMEGTYPDERRTWLNTSTKVMICADSDGFLRLEDILESYRMPMLVNLYTSKWGLRMHYLDLMDTLGCNFDKFYTYAAKRYFLEVQELLDSFMLDSEKYRRGIEECRKDFNSYGNHTFATHREKQWKNERPVKDVDDKLSKSGIRLQAMYSMFDQLEHDRKLEIKEYMNKIANKIAGKLSESFSF